MTRRARRVERHARCVVIGALVHQRLIGIRVIDIDKVMSNPGISDESGCCPSCSSKTAPIVRRDVLLTLQRMARLQWQIHSAATENGEFAYNALHLGRQIPTTMGHGCPAQQRLQTLGDGSAVVMQLVVISDVPAMFKRRAISRLNQSLLQPLDDWRLCRRAGAVHQWH